MEISSRDRVLQELNVSEEIELLEFLVQQGVRKSRTAIKGLLRRNQIVVNKKLVSQFDHLLMPNDVVFIMEYDQSKRERNFLGLKIIYEDEYLFVIDKEAGFLSVSTEREKNRTVFGVLTAYLKKEKRNADVFILHRVDREISGLMLVGKTAEIQNAFQKNWDNLVLLYDITGIIDGVLSPDNGSIKSWLTENKNYEVFSDSYDNGGMEAITHYSTIKADEKRSLVKFKQETRRKNQIRAQMEQKHTPIVGDRKYGTKNSPIKRVALHANYLKIKHPVTGKTHEFSSKLPASMEQLIR